MLPLCERKSSVPDVLDQLMMSRILENSLRSTRNAPPRSLRRPTPPRRPDRSRARPPPRLRSMARSPPRHSAPPPSLAPSRPLAPPTATARCRRTPARRPSSSTPPPTPRRRTRFACRPLHALALSSARRTSPRRSTKSRSAHSTSPRPGTRPLLPSSVPPLPLHASEALAAPPTLRTKPIAPPNKTLELLSVIIPPFKYL